MCHRFIARIRSERLVDLKFSSLGFGLGFGGTVHRGALIIGDDKKLSALIFFAQSLKIPHCLSL